jgi:DNA-binding NarL/FixJ family response regulator
MTTRRTRVFHVDDNVDAREMLGVLLRGEQDIEEVGRGFSAEGLVEEVRRTAPDVLVMDLKMPGKDPFLVMTALHAEFPLLKILVLTGCSDSDARERALAAGASGYIVKASDIYKTLDAIRA